MLAGEYSLFFQHNGFDWDAIEKAWDEAVKLGEKEAREEFANTEIALEGVAYAV